MNTFKEKLELMGKLNLIKEEINQREKNKLFLANGNNRQKLIQIREGIAKREKADMIAKIDALKAAIAEKENIKPKYGPNACYKYLKETINNNLKTKNTDELPAHYYNEFYKILSSDEYYEEGLTKDMITECTNSLVDIFVSPYC